MLFLFKLQQAEDRKYHRLFQCNLEREGSEIKAIHVTDVDEDYLVSYLAVVRQLMLHKEPACLQRVRDILAKVAERHSLTTMKTTLVDIQAHFDKRKLGIRYEFTGGSQTFENWTLIDLWLHHRYFHTTLEKEYLFYSVPEYAVNLSRKLMQVYVHDFVRYAIDHRPLIIEILAQGLLPKGHLDTAAFRGLQHLDPTRIRLRIDPMNVPGHS